MLAQRELAAKFTTVSMCALSASMCAVIGRSSRGTPPSLGLR